MKQKKDTGKVNISEQPGPGLRKAMSEDPERREHDDSDHAFTTDSPRWGNARNSEEERGYPREGGQPVEPTPRK